MSTDMINLGDDQLPAHLRDQAAADNNDLSQGTSLGFPVISYKGKTWAVVTGGEREMFLNADGDPRSSIQIIIIKASPDLSKVYYASGYTEGSTEPPDCFSNDGATPSVEASEPQADKCALCPKNQWGSRISEAGKKGKACSDYRRMAVVPAGGHDDGSPAHLLRVPPASLKGLVKYSKALDKRQLSYAAVVTKVSFEKEAATPQLVFEAVSYISEDQLHYINELREDTDALEAILASGHGIELEPRDAPAGDDPTAALDNAPQAEPTPKPKKAPAKKAKKPEPKVEDVEVEDVEEDTSASALLDQLDSELGFDD